MDDLTRKKLTELVGRFGRDVAYDARRCEALLRDLCPQCKREIFLLVSAAKESIPAELIGCSNGMPKPVLLTQLSKRLHKNLGVAENLARWSVESWALALGIAGPKDLRVPFKCPACSASGSAASRLVGQTVQCPQCHVSVCISPDSRETSNHASGGMPDQSPRTQASMETVVSQGSTVTTGNAAFHEEEDDLFSEFPRVSAEDMLRQTIRRVLADGIVTDEERAEVQRLRTSLGIAPDLAARILSEVKAELGIGRKAAAEAADPSTTSGLQTTVEYVSASTGGAVVPATQSSQTAVTPPPPSPGRRWAGRLVRLALLGVPVLLIYWLGWRILFVVLVWIVAAISGLSALGCGIGALAAKPDAKKGLWQTAVGLAFLTYWLLRAAVWFGH